MLWHDVVKFVNLLLQPPKGLLCQLDTYVLFSFTSLQKNLVNSNKYFFLFQLSGLGSEKYVLKACLSHGKRILPMKDDGYPYRILPDHGSDSRSWDRNRFVDTGN